MMRTKGPALVILCLLALMWALPAMAQEQTGSIQGTVKDSSGAVLPGVTVEARSPAVVGVSAAVTDDKGVYRFPALPPGAYTITATLQGFGVQKVTANLALGQLLTVDVALSPAGVAETVQVTGEAPLIDTKQNAAFATVSKETIDRIPKGRDFTSVIQTAPGANNESMSGGIQTDGASGSENRFIVDGMDTTNVINGTNGKGMLVDFIQEVQVKSSGYNAEFGGATGGVINAITKSGSNQMRGSFGSYFDNAKFRGAVRPTVRYSPFDSTVAETNIHGKRTPWNYYNPVADIGGPIVKDRLWYYGGVAYERNTYRTDNVIFATDTTLTPRNFSSWDWTVSPNYNITTQINNNMRLRVSGSNERYQTRRSTPGMQATDGKYLLTGACATDRSKCTAQQIALFNMFGNSTDGLSTSSFSTNQDTMDGYYLRQGSDSRQDVISGNLDWVLKPTFFINATSGYYRTNGWTPESFRGTALRHVMQTNGNSDGWMTKQGYPTVPAGSQAVGGYAPEKSSSGTEYNITDRLFFNANAIWYKSFKGQHVFKVGTRWERYGNNILRGNTFPVMTFYFGQAVNDPSGKAWSGKYGYYVVNQTGTIGQAHSNNTSIWGQDSWTVNNKLTINAGVRVENEFIPKFDTSPDSQNISFPFKDKIAPRLGFAYDVKGDSKWKLSGNFAYYYDITPLNMPRGSFGADHWINYYWTLDTYDWTGLNCGEGTSGCNGTFIMSRDLRRSSNKIDPLLSAYFGTQMTGVDPNMKPVQQGEFSLGGDHELSPTMSLGVRYVHKWLTKTIEDVGLLLNGDEVYIIANPGFGYTETMNMDFPSFKTPPATRKYDSVELRLRKRLANRWSGELSYTYSRLWGNYGGLASSDEAGRTDPNNNRYYDALYMSFNDQNQPVYGLLPTDRPHVIKAQGTYDLPWGTTIGAYGIIETGTPMTSSLSWQGYAVYFAGRGDLGRSPWYKQIDLNVQHDFRLGQNRRMSLQWNVTNLFDTQGWTRYYSAASDTPNTKWRGAQVTQPDSVFYGGPWNPDQVMATENANRIKAGKTPYLPEQFYLVPNVWQGYRQMRLMAKFSF